MRTLLAFEPDTGIFRWAVRRRSRTPAGTVAGYRDGTTGYVLITVAGMACGAHDLAWMWCHGQWPSGMLRHLNGDRSDNRCVNLALAV